MKPISMIAPVLLVSVLPIVLFGMPIVVSMIGDVTLVSIIAFILMGLEAGR